MKKLLLVLTILFSVSVLSAQVNENALGVRFGYGGGLSYQHGLNKTNRIEANLAVAISTYYTDIKVAAAYQWVFEVSSGLNVYVGPSAMVGIHSFDDADRDKVKGEQGLFIRGGGQIGVDYNFQSIPIQVSIDAMPQFAILNAIDNDFTFDPALGIRWVF